MDEALGNTERTDFEQRIQALEDNLLQSAQYGQELLARNEELEQQLLHSPIVSRNKELEEYVLASKKKEEVLMERIQELEAEITSPRPDTGRRHSIGNSKRFSEASTVPVPARLLRSRASTGNLDVEFCLLAEEWEGERKELFSAKEALQDKLKRTEQNFLRMQKELEEMSHDRDRLIRDKSPINDRPGLARSRTSVRPHSVQEEAEFFQSQIRDLKEDKDKYKHKYEAERQQKENSKHKIESFHSANQQLEEKLDVEKIRFTNLEIKYSELQKTLDHVQRRRTQLASRSTLARGSLAMAMGRAQSSGAESLASELGEAPAGAAVNLMQAEEIQEELENMRALVEHCKGEAVKAAMELESQVAELKQEGEELRGRNEQLTAEVAQLKQESDGLRERSKQLTTEVVQLKQESGELRERSGQLTAEAASEGRKLQQQKQEWSDEVARLRGLLGQVMKDKEALSRDNARQAAELQDAQEARLATEAQLGESRQDLERQRHAAKQQAAQLQKQLDGLRGESAQQAREFGQERGILRQRTQELESSITEASKQEQTVEEMRDAMAKLQHEADEARARSEAAEVGAADARRRQQELLQSVAQLQRDNEALRGRLDKAQKERSGEAPRLSLSGSGVLPKGRRRSLSGSGGIASGWSTPTPSPGRCSPAPDAAWPEERGQRIAAQTKGEAEAPSPTNGSGKVALQKALAEARQAAKTSDELRRKAVLAAEEQQRSATRGREKLLRDMSALQQDDKDLRSRVASLEQQRTQLQQQLQKRQHQHQAGVRQEASAEVPMQARGLEKEVVSSNAAQVERQLHDVISGLEVEKAKLERELVDARRQGEAAEAEMLCAFAAMRHMDKDFVCVS